MPDEIITDEPATGETAKTAPVTAEPVVPDGADNPDAVKAALKRERDAAKDAKKEADKLRARLQEFEDRDKTEQEKLADRVKDAEKRAADSEIKLARFEVAAEKGLDIDAVSVLSGNTREEIEQNAAKLSELLAARSAGAVPVFDGGARKTPEQKKAPEAAHNDFLAGLLRPQ